MDMLEKESEIAELIKSRYELLVEAEEYAKYCEMAGDKDRLIQALKMQNECREKIIQWQKKLYDTHLELVQV